MFGQVPLNQISCLLSREPEEQMNTIDVTTIQSDRMIRFGRCVLER